jgi:hypothetical protein
MASRFTALPLSSGESFILETDHAGKRWVILYDGGQTKGIGPAKNQLYKLLREHCPEITNRIDIAVCSHSDHDHSGGFPDFVDTWTSEGNEIGEFWLPSHWSPALPEVLTNPDRVISRLMDGAGRVAESIVTEEDRAMTAKFNAVDGARSSFRSIEQIVRDRGRSIFDERRMEPLQPLHPLSDAPAKIDRQQQVAASLGLDRETLAIIRRNLEDSASLRIPMTERMSDNVLLWPDIIEGGESRHLRRTFAKSVMETAESIQRIATAAAEHEILVRWFDFTTFESGEAPSGGILGFFQPLNTIEVHKVERETDGMMLFLSLKLTEQNVSSLVFQRVGSATEPSVVFVADSRLAFGIDQPEGDFPKHLIDPGSPIIFTAAHHGSRNNDRAYEVLAAWLGNHYQESMAVRNGGVHNQTLADYCTVKNRRCAQCYQCHGGDWAQLVQFVSESGAWIWPPEDGKKCGKPKGVA